MRALLETFKCLSPEELLDCVRLVSKLWREVSEAEEVWREICGREEMGQLSALWPSYQAMHRSGAMQVLLVDIAIFAYPYATGKNRFRL